MSEPLVWVRFTGPIGEAQYRGYVFPLNEPVAVPESIARKLESYPAFEVVQKPPS